MAENPFILFADPIPADKAKRNGRGTPFFCPPHQRQIERLSPQFGSLQQALENGRVRLAQNAHGIEPEYTLVLEVAEDPAGFEIAVRNLNVNTEGVEWLFEVVNDHVPNNDDFYRTNKLNVRDDTKVMSYKYFCILTNQRVLEEILSLWQMFRADENYIFPRGKTGLRNVFRTLSDIHIWGVKERLEETGVLEIWAEDIKYSDTTEINCEIELFFRNNAEKRILSQSKVSECILHEGGTIITSSCIEAIGYHALLASLPRISIEKILNNENIELIQLDQIMFFKPTGQSIVLGTEDGFPFEQVFLEPEKISDDPIVALFDGLPQEQHPLLRGLLTVDDPDDLSSSYQIMDRHHGTSMASLIARGDLTADEEPLISYKIYVRPIMIPYPAAHGTREFVPDNILIVDKIHEAVIRLYEPAAGRVAPNVRLINLSIGIDSRMYYNMVSPLAKLLDWLSFKYRILFIVSAGNHNTDIDLGITFSAYKALSITERDSQMVQILNRESRNLRLLSPAESINALTVGALFADKCQYTENQRQILPCSETLPNPVSSMGRGVNNSIKPDILYPGGRSVLNEIIGTPSGARWRNSTSLYPPGTLSAKPLALAGNSNIVGYSFGTSDATALITHEAALCYDVLNEVFHDELGTSIPSEYVALLVKAMVVHGAEWNPSTLGLICEQLELPGRGADQLHKWMGYGVPNISLVKEWSKNKATLIGYGELFQDQANQYSFPLPFNFSAQKMYRRLTITLSTLTPIKPSTQTYRSAQVWFTLETFGKNLGLERINADNKAVARGTIQHELFEGDGAVVWGEEDTLGIKINCRADANEFAEAIPYAIFATFEIAPEYNIDVYQRVVEKVKIRERITPR